MHFMLWFTLEKRNIVTIFSFATKKRKGTGTMPFSRQTRLAREVSSSHTVSHNVIPIMTQNAY